jgi:putative FmdB family regulatory protein
VLAGRFVGSTGRSAFFVSRQFFVPVQEAIMPLYDYQCGRCECEFSELRPMALCAEPASCPQCAATAPRRISAPRLAVLTTSQRQAHQINERSAHEPRTHRKHVCGSGCSHGSTGHAQGHAHAKATEASKPALRQSKSTSRPWMIGH